MMKLPGLMWGRWIISIKPVSPAIVIRRGANVSSLVHIKELEDSQREAIYMLGAARSL